MLVKLSSWALTCENGVGAVWEIDGDEAVAKAKHPDIKEANSFGYRPEANDVLAPTLVQ